MSMRIQIIWSLPEDVLLSTILDHLSRDLTLRVEEEINSGQDGRHRGNAIFGSESVDEVFRGESSGWRDQGGSASISS